jgi:hypothetical protein
MLSRSTSPRVLQTKIRIDILSNRTFALLDNSKTSLAD